MKNIPTAEEYVNTRPYVCAFLSSAQGFEILTSFMIEFAKLHVEAALEAANNKVNYAMEEFGAVFPDTVLNVYPLNNIK
jgi:hypothetical protein